MQYHTSAEVSRHAIGYRKSVSTPARTMKYTVPAPPRAGPVLQKDGTFIQPWAGFFQGIYNLFNSHASQINSNTSSIQTIQQSLAAGINASVTLAKLTTTGAEGTMTFSNGILTAYTAPT